MPAIHPTPHQDYSPTLGARYEANGSCRFRVWAPLVKCLELRLLDPHERIIPMHPLDRGYFECALDSVAPGARYFYRINRKHDRPDPASRFQPEGVHGPSAVVDRAFDWTDHGWCGPALHEYITYELHIGTYTPEGTFDAAIEHLADLSDLSVSAIEIMPVAQFPGDRNWGYDGVHPFAVQNTYGGPAGLRRFIDAAHARGLAIVMDVVYNHLGPEGNYLGEFGHYFTDRYHTPWGKAINFDCQDSDEVRRFFVENALFWIDEYHVDSLRLDAVHAIFDRTAISFLQELADAVRREGARLGRNVFTIAESSLNDARLVTPRDAGGMDIDAQWCNDLHHALHTQITPERAGYYADFAGRADLAKACREGFVLDGRYSLYRGRRHGNSARHIDPKRLVVFAQNHDQVGNRPGGDRLAQLASLEELKLAASVILLSPYLPLLFMGEEYAETAPFLFFTSYSDTRVIESVRRGRTEFFSRLGWSGGSADPQAEEAFLRSKLDHSQKLTGHHAILREYYKTLVRIRRHETIFSNSHRDRIEVVDIASASVIAVRQWNAHDELVTIFHFGSEPASATGCIPSGTWEKLVDSAETRWQGPGSTLPPRLESLEQAELLVTPKSAVAFAR